MGRHLRYAPVCVGMCECLRACVRMSTGLTRCVQAVSWAACNLSLCSAAAAYAIIPRMTCSLCYYTLSSCYCTPHDLRVTFGNMYVCRVMWACTLAGVEYLLPATWTALKRHGSDLQRLATILARAPAKLAGLDNRKGKIAVGYDADIVVSLSFSVRTRH